MKICGSARVRPINWKNGDFLLYSGGQGGSLLGMIDDIPRLSPQMASRKLQVLAFIRAFYAAHGVGPSLSEMAAAIGSNRSRVQDAIRKLAAEGRIHRAPGQTRGVRPLSAQEEAVRHVRDAGYLVLDPASVPLLDIEMPVTKAGLPGHSPHGHNAPLQGGGGYGADGGEERAGR